MLRLRRRVPAFPGRVQPAPEGREGSGQSCHTCGGPMPHGGGVLLPGWGLGRAVREEEKANHTKNRRTKPSTHRMGQRGERRLQRAEIEDRRDGIQGN